MLSEGKSIHIDDKLTGRERMNDQSTRQGQPLVRKPALGRKRIRSQCLNMAENGDTRIQV